MFAMMRAMPAPPPSSLLVVCLCAQWCGSCRDYRSTFDEVAASFPTANFRWVDIEDEADLVDPVEVENFPTLLIAAADGPRFFGPVTPHRETLARLLRAQIESGGTTTPASDLGDNVRALARRLHAR